MWGRSPKFPHQEHVGDIFCVGVIGKPMHDSTSRLRLQSYDIHFWIPNPHPKLKYEIQKLGEPQQNTLKNWVTSPHPKKNAYLHVRNL